jgi:hypothetical protein
MSPEDAPVNSNRNRDGASRTSGTRPSARSADTTAFRKPTFRSFSKRPNFASTTEHPASNCELSNAGQTQALANRSGTAPKKIPPLPARPSTIKSVSSFRLQLVTPPAAGHIRSGEWKCVNIDSVFLQQTCREASRNEVSVGSGSSWESSEPSGAYLGRSAGPLHGHKRAFHVHGGYAERKIAGVAGRLRLPSRLGPCQRFIVACVRLSRSGCSTTEGSGASSGFAGRPRQPRQATPSIRPHFRGA